MGELVVLGIESSCDDTAAAIVTGDGVVLGEAIAGQADLHAVYGGVHPAAASRAHAAAIDRVVAEALSAAALAPRDLSAVAVTVGPGLGLCLEVGVRKARALSRGAALPLVPVHHMEAHALVARLPAAAASAAAAAAAAATTSCGTHGSSGGQQRSREVAAESLGSLCSPTFPFLCLLVSGGHNLLVLARGVGDYLELGGALDDALGEAYDKVARMLGLELKPHGGAALEVLARRGDPNRFTLPVPMRRRANCDFSFAGLKTGVRLAIERDLPPEGDPGRVQAAADMAASFQAVATQHLCDRLRRGIGWARDTLAGGVSGSAAYGRCSASGCGESGDGLLRHLVVAGGVASNQYIRGRLAQVAANAGLELVVPPSRWCTDNGVMVAWAGVERYRLGLYQPPLGPLELPPGGEQEWVELRPRWPMTSEKHGDSTPPGRSHTAAAKQSRSLTDDTRDALAALRAVETAAAAHAAEAEVAARDGGTEGDGSLPSSNAWGRHCSGWSPN